MSSTSMALAYNRNKEVPFESVYPFSIPTKKSVGVPDAIRYPMDYNRVDDRGDHFGGLYHTNQSLPSMYEEEPVRCNNEFGEDDYLDLPVVARDGHSDVPTDYPTKVQSGTSQTDFDYVDYALGHRNAHSMLSGGHTVPYHSDYRSYGCSCERDLGSDSVVYSEYRPSLNNPMNLYLMNRNSSHRHMCSSPPVDTELSFNQPHLQTHYSSSTLPSHQNSETQAEDMARLLRRPSSLYHSQRPSQEYADPPQSTEMLSGKLPYACRDFRNGQCYRGEKCRFMHVYDMPTHTDTLRQCNKQICRDFMRGQCQRKNCKFLHVFPQSVDTPTYAHVVMEDSPNDTRHSTPSLNGRRGNEKRSRLNHNQMRDRLLYNTSEYGELLQEPELMPLRQELWN